MKDAVENLARVFIDLRREGCVQFENMYITVYCDPAHDPGVEISFRSLGKALMGVKESKTALEHCLDIYVYLKDCVKMWREMTTDIRRLVHISLSRLSLYC